MCDRTVQSHVHLNETKQIREGRQSRHWSHTNGRRHHYISFDDATLAGCGNDQVRTTMNACIWDRVDIGAIEVVISYGIMIFIRETKLSSSDY